MKVFAVSDLHLPGRQNKPMDVFGGNWTGHIDKIKEDWKSKVGENDVVLIAGDLSWAMSMEDGLSDLRTLVGLPGKKVFIKGNHDYWWSGITALRRAAPDDSFFFLQNDCVKFEDLVVCGSRGWTCPGSMDFTEADKKIYQREGERFKLVFNSVKNVREEGDRLLCMIHYPPFNAKREETLFTKAFEENGVEKVVYGHLHANAGNYPFVCERGGIRYYLTSCDLLNFKLTQIY